MSTRLIPLEDFFRNAQEAAYQLSPDGRFLSFMAPYKDCMNVFVKPTTGGEAIRLTSETERSIGGYAWADDDRLVYVKDHGGDENYALYGIRPDGTDGRAYTAFDGVKTVIIDDLEEVPGQMIIGLNRRNREVFDPYRLDLNTGDLTLLAENPGNWQGWTTDHQGRLRAVTAIEDGVNTTLLYRPDDTEPF